MIDVNTAIGMLPPPRVPSRPRWPSADAVAALAGDAAAEPIRVADAAQKAAEAAVDELERRRPGGLGTKWREAIEADAAAYAAARTPEKWEAARLLEGDPQMWAQARVLAGAVAPAWREAGAALDRPKIREAAAKVAADLTSRFERVARAGWEVRSDPHRAWPLRGEGETIITQYRGVQGIVYWADGATFDPANDAFIPGGPETRGLWICLDLVLHPKKTLLGIPKGITWPEGAERLLGMAIPAGRGFAELRRDGYHEIAEVV